MAPTNNDDERPNANEKVLHVWSKPIAEGDQVPGPQVPAKNPDGTPRESRSAFSEAVSMIKKEDFANVANTPCARQGLLTGIGAGAGLGGLKFVIQGITPVDTRMPLGWIGSGVADGLRYDRQCRQIGELGSWLLHAGQHSLIRILPVPTTCREDPDEAAHRGGYAEPERAGKKTRRRET